MNETGANFFRQTRESKQSELQELKKANKTSKSKQPNPYNTTQKSTNNDFFTKTFSPSKTTKGTLSNYYDSESLYKENINLKNMLHKKNNIINELKFSNIKLGELNKKNIKSIESILVKGGGIKKENQNQSTLEEDRDNININTKEHFFTAENVKSEEEVKVMQTDMSQAEASQLTIPNMSRIKENYIITGMKNQLLSVKNQIKELKEENERLRANSRCAKYAELESNHTAQLSTYYATKEKYENLRQAMTVNEQKIISITQEKDNYKQQYLKIKEKFEETHTNFQKYQEESLFGREKIRTLEEKVKNLEFKVSSQKTTIADKDKEIESYKQDIVLLESYKKDRPEIEKKLTSYYHKCTSLKDENEKKTARLKELELSSTKLKDETEKKVNSYTKKYKDLENTIKSLKADKEDLFKQITDLNAKLKEREEEIAKLNSDVFNKTEELKAEDKELNNTKEKITTLEEKVELTNRSLQEKEQKIIVLEEKNSSLQDEIKRLNEEKVASTNPGTGEEGVAVQAS